MRRSHAFFPGTNWVAALRSLFLFFILTAQHEMLAAPGALDSQAQAWTFRRENVLGTSFDLKLSTSTEALARQGESAALTEITRLSHLLSTYDSTSEASRWLASRGTATAISTELFQMLALFDHWRDRTGGALDPAAGTLSALWKKAAAVQQIPTTEELRLAVESIRKSHWHLDTATRTATHLSDAPLAFNSFVKSFIIRLALQAAVAASAADSATLNIGGDIITHGTFPESVDIADPLNDAENAPPISQVRIRNLAIATSGGYRRGFQVGDRWFSHIMDPRTGQPAGHILSATVIAPLGESAGALATSLCVLSPEESLRLVASEPGAECLILTADGHRITSPGWNRYQVVTRQLVASTDSTAIPSASSSNGTWDPSMELLVSLEIAPSNDPRYRRPFVAVWIEDNDKYPVRTIALWYKGDRWLPDLRAWYHADQLRALTEGNDLTPSISSATRGAGRYTVKWDGKDNGGKWVKAGKYTVHIEAAREHGTYQVAKQEIDFSGTPAKFDLKAGAELSKIHLDYHKK